MSTARAAVLLAQLRGRGVELFAAGERVHYRPKTAVNSELRRRIERVEPELLTLLRSAGPAENAATRSGGTERTETSSGDDASCSSFGSGLAPIGDFVSGSGVRTVPCRCCGSLDFWALAHVGHWVCARCHQPGQARDELIWLSVFASPSQVSGDRPKAACLTCGGARFVRLKNGRRSICATCESPAPEDIEGEDDGLIGGPIVDPDGPGGAA